jgi:serine/threonine-protein kinase
MGAIMVSAITATVVVTVALLFFRRDKTSATIPSASASAGPVAPPSTPVPLSTAHPSSAASADPNPASLPYGYAYLTVVSPAVANVYVSGKLAGPVNKPLKVRCGTWFVRLAGQQEGRFPEWVSRGETVVIPCQESTRLDMNPHHP